MTIGAFWWCFASNFLQAQENDQFLLTHFYEKQTLTFKKIEI